MSTSTNAITPDLQAKLDKAREEHTNGETLCFGTAQDAIACVFLLLDCADFHLQNFCNLKKDRERFGFLR